MLFQFQHLLPPARLLLRGCFGLVPPHHRRSVSVFLLWGGAAGSGAAVGRGAAAGGRGSVGQGEREGRRGVRGRRKGISVCGAQRGVRWKRERQREPGHVEEPADPPSHLWRRDHRTVNHPVCYSDGVECVLVTERERGRER